MPKIRLAAAMTLLMAFGMANSAVRADALETLPDSTLVALKVANLTKTSDKVAKPAADKKIDETTAKVVKVEGAKTEAKAAKMGTKVDEKAPKTTDAVKATDAKATTEAKPAEKAGDKKVEEKKPENKN